MDLNAIKSKLEKLQTKPEKYEKKDYTLTQWKPAPGKYVIRIVPSKNDKSNPFTELKFYYEFDRKTILSPLSYGEKDPIAMLAAKLRENYSAENFALAKQISPKTRIYVPVIVRGEEDKGVRLWNFGKLVYEELLALAADEEIGDYTDIANGLDIKVEIQSKEQTGTDYPKTTIRTAMKTSALGTKDQVKLWLTEQPDPVDEFKHYTFDELKTILEKFINPEEIEHDESTYVTEEDEDNTQVSAKKTKFNLDIENVKQTKQTKFDAMFEEKEDEEEDAEELPMESEEDLPINTNKRVVKK